MSATTTRVNVFVGQGRKVHVAYTAANGQASTVCGAERRGAGVTYTRKTDAAATCLACAPTTEAQAPEVTEEPAAPAAAPAVTYTRGTATTKITTARLVPGTVLLTFKAGEHSLVAYTKTGAELRTVASTEKVAAGPFERQTRTVVRFTDGTSSISYSSSQTWMTCAAPAPFFAAPEAPAEEPAAPEAPAEEPAADSTKAYRIGKLLREFVLASDDDGHHRVSAALVDHVASRNVCYDGTATLRLTPAFAEELINAASEMDAEAKAAARAARRTLYALFA